ncbi:MAG: hypothetical protein OXC03_02100 [Flavobacteriaceae bacterium]|nr:hypothetical protein [Flavobacteriaceae bacterium]
MNWDNTQNLYIERDNLEVLKPLHRSYAGKIKMIYIDPPYNTGDENFVEANFLNQITWKSTHKNDPKYIAINHEYSFVYSPLI